MPSRLLPLSSRCLFVVLIGMLVLGQSSRATLGNQPNGLSIEPHQGLRDVNGDGKADFMVANYCAIKSNFAHGVMGVLLGNGAGTFPLAHRAST